MQVKNFLTIGIFSILLVSCSKKSNDPVDVPIEGNWVGKFSVLSGPYSNFFSFSIKPNGVLELRDAAQQKIGEGTWEMDSNIFEGTYKTAAPDNKTFSVLASFKGQTGELDGTWGPDANEYTGGYWYMERVN